MFGSLAMVAQTTVTGTVKDASTGETLLGANVKVSRQAIGTTTKLVSHCPANCKFINKFCPIFTLII